MAKCTKQWANFTKCATVTTGTSKMTAISNFVFVCTEGQSGLATPTQQSQVSANLWLQRESRTPGKQWSKSSTAPAPKAMLNAIKQLQTLVPAMLPSLGKRFSAATFHITRRKETIKIPLLGRSTTSELCCFGKNGAMWENWLWNFMETQKKWVGSSSRWSTICSQWLQTMPVLLFFFLTRPTRPPPGGSRFVSARCPCPELSTRQMTQLIQRRQPRLLPRAALYPHYPHSGNLQGLSPLLLLLLLLHGFLLLLRPP